MKKPGSNQQPPNRGSGQKRGNSNTSRNGQNRNNVNKNSRRNAGHGGRSHTPHLWASSASSSTTLTSHLSMGNRRSQDGVSKNTNSTNGGKRSNGKPRVKSSYNQNGQIRNDAQRHSNKRHSGKKPSTVRQNRPHGDPRTTLKISTQENKTKYNKTLESKTNTFGIDPFELFCAYHLGISSKNQYRPSNINEVANRFKIDTGTTRQILKEYGMDSASLLDRDFDMALAQLDIQVAPEGINRTELGRSIFEDFLEAPMKKRDWGKILEEDKKENAKTFGRQ